MIYPVAISRQNQQYIARVPDLPELAISGESMADVIHNARIVIIEHLQARANNNQPITSGQDLSTHLANPDFFGHIWAIISLDSLHFAQQTLPYQLNIPKTTLNAIYQVLGNHTDIDAVQNFIINAIEHQLDNSKNKQSQSA